MHKNFSKIFIQSNLRHFNIKLVGFMHLKKFDFCTYNSSTSNSTASQSTSSETSFGFKTVKTEERQSLVNSVFENVAKK